MTYNDDDGNFQISSLTLKNIQKRSIMFRSGSNNVPKVPAKSATSNRVVIDSGSVLRIIKHAYDQYPSQASGQLLGIDEDSVLDVTYSFAYPASINEHDVPGIKGKALTKYQQEYIEHLKEVNIEANSVGWYMTANLGKFVSRNVIENMLQFQIANPESILLVHDVSRSAQTDLSLRAFRLSEQYLAVKSNGAFASDVLEQEKLSYENLFQELPVSIHNSHLVTLYLQSHPKKKDYKNLNTFIDSYLERNIEEMFESVDDFSYDLNNYNYYQRSVAREKTKIQQWEQKRKAENLQRQHKGQEPLSMDDWKSLYKIPEEPSRLDKLLISAQLDQYCNQIEEFGSTVSTKLFASKQTTDFV